MPLGISSPRPNTKRRLSRSRSIAATIAKSGGLCVLSCHPALLPYESCFVLCDLRSVAKTTPCNSSEFSQAQGCHLDGNDIEKRRESLGNGWNVAPLQS